MKALLDNIPLGILIVLTIFMSLAPYPFAPEPHLLQKIKMLAEGTLTRPIDIFDLFWHGIWGVLLVLKLVYKSK